MWGGGTYIGRLDWVGMQRRYTVHQHTAPSSSTTTLSNMPQALEAAQSQWLAQLAEMRQALAELKHHHLPTHQSTAYGEDVHLEDDDLCVASGNDDDDYWNSVTDVDDNDSSDEPPHVGVHGYLDGQQEYDQSWLTERCNQVASAGSGLNGEALKQQLTAILAADYDGKC